MNAVSFPVCWGHNAPHGFGVSLVAFSSSVIKLTAQETTAGLTEMLVRSKDFHRSQVTAGLLRLNFEQDKHKN